MTTDEEATMVDVPASIDIANARRDMAFGVKSRTFGVTHATYCDEFRAQMRFRRIMRRNGRDHNLH